MRNPIRIIETCKGEVLKSSQKCLPSYMLRETTVQLSAPCRTQAGLQPVSKWGGLRNCKRQRAIGLRILARLTQGDQPRPSYMLRETTALPSGPCSTQA